MLVNKGDFLIEFQKKKLVTQRLFWAHFLSFTQDIQGFRKGHTVLKNYLKTNFRQTKDKLNKNLKKGKVWS